MPRVALSMIVRDCEASLPACLESARGLVDELVVADTGSVDATPAVARQCWPNAWLYSALSDASQQSGACRIPWEENAS